LAIVGFFILQTCNDENLQLLTKKMGATIASATVAPTCVKPQKSKKKSADFKINSL
jgi:hypothetical protein